MLLSKSFLLKIFPCIISFGILIYFCVENNNFITLIGIFPKLNILYFILSIVSIILYWITDGMIIKELLPEFSKSRIDYIKLTMYGQFYGSITPFASGGQASQLYILNSANVDAGKSVVAFSQKFFISQLCTVIISSLCIIFKTDKFGQGIPGFTFITLIGLFIQCSGIVSLVLCYINKKSLMNLLKIIFNFLEKIKIIKNSKDIYSKVENKLVFLMENSFSVNCGPKVYLMCLIQNISFCMVSFFISKSFGCRGFPLLDFIAAQTFINLISIVNPLPGSAGTVEGSFLFLYKYFFSKENLPSAMILFRLINYYLGMIIGFFVVISNKKFRNKNNFQL